MSFGRDKKPVVLLDERELLAIPQEEWRIKGLLPTTGVVCLYGAPGSCKSFLGIDMLAALRQDGDYMGFRVRAGCKTVYAPFEGQSGVPKRVEAWRKHHGADMSVRFIVHPWNLADVLDLQDFVEGLKQWGFRDGVLLLDTLSAAFPGINENASEGMGVVIAAAKRIAYELACLVIVVHHTGKEEGRGARGWSGLKGAVDVELECRKAKKGGKHDRELELVKVKDGESGRVVPFRVMPVDLGLDADGDPRSSLVVVPATTEVHFGGELARQGLEDELIKDEQFVHDWIAQLNATNVHPSRNALESMRQAKAAHLSKERLSGTVARLISNGRVSVEGSGPKQWLRATE